MYRIQIALVIVLEKQAQNIRKLQILSVRILLLSCRGLSAWYVNVTNTLKAEKLYRG